MKLTWCIFFCLTPVVVFGETGERVILPGNVHALARKEFDQGAAPPSLPMSRMRVVLRRTPAQQRDVNQFLKDIQDRSSPNHHRWLTPVEFGARFGPGQKEIEALMAWLKGEGFRSIHASAGRTVIEFSGTAGLVESALGTTIHRYQIGGANYWANATEPSLPASLAVIAQGFAGLNNLARSAARTHPLHNVPGSPFTHAIAPGDFATIYNLGPNYPTKANGMATRSRS